LKWPDGWAAAGTYSEVAAGAGVVAGTAAAGAAEAATPTRSSMSSGKTIKRGMSSSGHLLIRRAIETVSSHFYETVRAFIRNSS
jgi:hypothetical protein